MPKGFTKIIHLLLGLIVLTGCASQMASSFTFGSLLILDSVTYFTGGMVGPMVLFGWRVLTWITYIQLVGLFLQFGALYLSDQLEKWENGQAIDLQKLPFMTLIYTIGGLLMHILVVYGITWLHFPAVRGVDVYPGVGLQMILVTGNFLLGLYIVVGIGLDPNGRSRKKHWRQRQLRKKAVSQKWLGRRKPVQLGPPRGLLRDGTVLPKPTQRPRRAQLKKGKDDQQNRGSE